MEKCTVFRQAENCFIVQVTHVATLKHLVSLLNTREKVLCYYDLMHVVMVPIISRHVSELKWDQFPLVSAC